MRTTIDIDDDVLEAVRAIARSERRGMGTVVSNLVRRGLVPPRARIDTRGAFPVFQVPEGTAAITDAMVRLATEET